MAVKKLPEAVKNAVSNGLTFGAPTKKELEIAEIMNSLMFPWENRAAFRSPHFFWVLQRLHFFAAPLLN